MAKITVHGGPSQWLGEPEPPRVVAVPAPESAPAEEAATPSPPAVKPETEAAEARDEPAANSDGEEPKPVARTLPRRGSR